MQVGFVTVRTLAAWLRLDKVTFCCCKLFLCFVAVTFFSFLVSVLFVAVELDKIRKPLHLLVAVGSYFLLLPFSFHTASRGAFLFFSVLFGVDNVAYCIFKKQF